MDVFEFIHRVWAAYSSGWGLCVVAGLYLWLALCLMLIARKNNIQSAWVAWIPIANLRLMCVIGEAPPVCFWGLFLPVLALAAGIVLWMPLWILVWTGIWAVAWAVKWILISRSRGRPGAFGLLMVIPVINLAVLGSLAFGD